MPGELTLTVNGVEQIITVDSNTPLLFVLRNELKLTGPKMGCGIAQCGACAVLLDGDSHLYYAGFLYSGKAARHH